MAAKNLALAGNVSIREAERIVSSLGVAPEFVDPIRIDFREVGDWDLGAAPRISNALRRYKDVGIVAEVPGAVDGIIQADYFTKYWRLFVRSGVGAALSDYAYRIQSNGYDITAAFRESLATFSEIGQNAVTIREIHLPSSINAAEPDEFLAAMQRFMPLVNVSVAAWGLQSFAPLCELCREAILNARDHAFQSPFPKHLNNHSFLSLRYYKGLFKRGQDDGPLEMYFRRLNQQIQLDKREVPGVLEILVNDDGVGIAARQSQNLQIFWSQKDKEEQILSSALTAGVSIKPVTRDATMRGDPGYGFTIIANSLRRLSGFASVRTGRCLVTFDGTRTDPLSTGFSLVRSGYSGSLSYMPGTLLHAVIPILPAQQKINQA